jgi:hypothetical protein
MNPTTALGLVLAAAFAALGAAKIARTPSMRARAEHVGFSAEAYQLIGTAEVLGAAGVVAGLFSSTVGRVAAAGLLLLLAGAVGAHLRSGDRVRQLAPAVLFAAGTVGYLVALGAS